MTEQTAQPSRFTFRTLVLLLIPIILLVGVIFLFLSTGGGLDLQSAAPADAVVLEEVRDLAGLDAVHDRLAEGAPAVGRRVEAIPDEVRIAEEVVVDVGAEVVRALHPRQQVPVNGVFRLVDVYVPSGSWATWLAVGGVFMAGGVLLLSVIRAARGDVLPRARARRRSAPAPATALIPAPA